MSNFDFLRNMYPKLADLGAGAERNYGVDNEICMIKLGQLAEGIAWQLSDAYGLGPFDSNEARIQALWEQGILPEQIYRDLHALRKTRNYCVHAVIRPSLEQTAKITDTDCLSRLKMAYNLTVWFFEKYGDGTYPDQPFVIPPRGLTVEKYQQLNQELINRIAELKRNLRKQQDNQQNENNDVVILKLQQSIRQAEAQLDQYRRQKEDLEKALASQHKEVVIKQKELHEVSARAEQATQMAHSAKKEASATAQRLEREIRAREHIQAESAEELRQAQNALEEANRVIQRMEKDISLRGRRISHLSEQYCPHCFATIDAPNDKCPKCGWEIGKQKCPQALCTNTILDEQFMVGTVIEQNDVTISYIGFDRTLHRKVTIVEYFPRFLVNRDGKCADVATLRDSCLETDFWRGLRRFVAGAQAISEAGSSRGILTVYDILEINDTAYVILEDTDGISFLEYVRQNANRISVTAALRILQPIFFAVDYLQQNQIPHQEIGSEYIVLKNGQGCLAFVPSDNSQSQNTWDLKQDIQSIACLFYDALVGDRDTFPNFSECEQLSAEQAEILKSAAVTASELNPFKTLEQFYQALYSATPKQPIKADTPKNKEKLFDTLTVEQKKAVTTESKRMVVIAGPGSGKTHVLTERISYLLQEKHVPDKEILALTFTSKAANEMQRRILKLLPEQGKYYPNVRTFHSLGLQILRTYGDLLGYHQNFRVLNTPEKNKILREILQKIHVSGEFVSFYAQTISKYKNQAVVGDLPREFNVVFSDYQAQLLDQNSIDFDDMLYQTLLLFRENELVRQQIGATYSHILVDEFQDVNKAQIEMLQNLLCGKAAFFIVGDDDQCIYEWRGSKPNFLHLFAHSDKNDVIKLEDNFRSESPIVQLSNSFIAHNQNRIPKQMRAHARQSSLCQVNQNMRFIRLDSKKTQAEFCAHEIQRLVLNGNYNYDDFAILVRFTRQMEAIKDALSINHVPYTSSSDDATRYDRFLVVLQTVNAFYQPGNLAKAINYPTRVLDNITWKNLAARFELDEWNYQKAMEYLYLNNIDFDGAELFRSRYQFLYSLYCKKQELTAAEVVSELLSHYKIESESNGLSMESRSSIAFAQQVLDIAEEYTKADTGLHLHGALQSFLEFLQTALRDESNLTYGSDAVKLMTCHKSKGLEFPVVIIPSVQVGEFPDDKLTITPEQLEEERRLFYVTMTRAKEKLYILCYEDPLTNPNSNSIVKRGFLAEIPNIVLES